MGHELVYSRQDAEDIAHGSLRNAIHDMKGFLTSPRAHFQLALRIALKDPNLDPALVRHIEKGLGFIEAQNARIEGLREYEPDLEALISRERQDRITAELTAEAEGTLQFRLPL